jgi:hypothetical protein
LPYFQRASYFFFLKKWDCFELLRILVFKWKKNHALLRPTCSSFNCHRSREGTLRSRFAAAMALPASSSGLFRFLSPRSRPQSTDIIAAATWGVFAGSAAIYLVQVRVNRPASLVPHRGLVWCVLGARGWLLPIGSVVPASSLFVWICALLDRSQGSAI